jgi:hypothetical protein
LRDATGYALTPPLQRCQPAARTEGVAWAAAEGTARAPRCCLTPRLQCMSPGTNDDMRGATWVPAHSNCTDIIHYLAVIIVHVLNGASTRQHPAGHGHATLDPCAAARCATWHIYTKSESIKKYISFTATSTTAQVFVPIWCHCLATITLQTGICGDIIIRSTFIWKCEKDLTTHPITFDFVPCTESNSFGALYQYIWYSWFFFSR